MHASWSVYEPVGLPGGSPDLDLPRRSEVVEAAEEEITRFINREIFPKVSALQGKIRENNNEPKYINRLGVFYAKWGLNEKAKSKFDAILEKREYVPALVNMGNIYFLDKDMMKALGYYERAERQRKELDAQKKRQREAPPVVIPAPGSSGTPHRLFQTQEGEVASTRFGSYLEGEQ